MYTTCNNRLIERQLDREMYTTCNNRQIKRQLDREVEEEVGTGSCIQYVTIDRGRDSEIVRQRDVYNIRQQIDKKSYLDREVEAVGTGICILHVPIDL